MHICPGPCNWHSIQDQNMRMHAVACISGNVPSTGLRLANCLLSPSHKMPSPCRQAIASAAEESDPSGETSAVPAACEPACLRQAMPRKSQPGGSGHLQQGAGPPRLHWTVQAHSTPSRPPTHNNHCRVRSLSTPMLA